jgi:hypothetical protein
MINLSKSPEIPVNPIHLPPTSAQTFLLTAMILPWLPAHAQTIPNPSFEESSFVNFPGYISGNAPIPGWTANLPNRAGLNPSPDSPFANNGAIPDGANVAFLQSDAGGPTSLTTTITDLVVGQRYNVTFRVNARNQPAENIPHLRISVDAEDPAVSAQVTRVATTVDGTPYRWAGYFFTATSTSHNLTISNTRTSGDHTLLIDDFKIAPGSNAWGISPWTGDADSGIDSQYIYTHAVNFGTNVSPLINGVRFLGRDDGRELRFALSNLPNSTGRTSSVTGNSAALANQFRYDGANTGITLQNLKPNTEYLFTLYGFGWDAADSTTPWRGSTFGSNLTTERMTANLNQYGLNNGMLVTYRYTTDAVGSPVVISYPTLGGMSFHSSGFSNRETTPATAPVVWTAAPWTDDASSGIDGSYHYTHAVNLGTAQSVNVNGVNFTGVAGGSPATPDHASTVPSVFAGDVNEITGHGSGLARDFLYGYPHVHNLSGLTPGKDYVFTIYSAGWEAPGVRLNALLGNAGEQITVFDQGNYGDNKGIRFEYRYTASESGTLKVSASALDGASSLHSYAISNREAEPMVDVAPIITLQPQTTTLGVGSPLTLRAGAIGSGALSYQWQRDGADLPGENGPDLVFSALEFGDSGDYSVIIKSALGEVVSDVATVTVLYRVPGLANTGTGIDGKLLAHGEADPNYFLLANPQDPESDVAYVQLSGIPGAWLANSSTSTWVGPLANTTNAAGTPTDGGAGPGIYVYRTQFDLTGFDLDTVSITGGWSSDNAGLEMVLNGESIGYPNELGNTFAVVVPFTINHETAPGLVQGVNTLDFVVRNDGVGFTGLRVVDLVATGMVLPGTAPHIAFHPIDASAATGGTATLAVQANGSGDLNYTWFFNDTEIPGESGSVLTISNFSAAQVGAYRVQVSNAAGSAESEIANVSLINTPPSFPGYAMSTPNGSPATISFSKLLAEATDVDGNSITVTAASAGSVAGGTITLGENSLTYTPPDAFTGVDSFQITITDELGGSSTGTVTVNVIEPSGQGSNSPKLVVLPNGHMQVTFQGIPGRTYELQRSTDLESWTTIGSLAAGPTGALEVVDDNPPTPNAFYRLSNP